MFIVLRTGYHRHDTEILQKREKSKETREKIGQTKSKREKSVVPPPKQMWQTPQKEKSNRNKTTTYKQQYDYEPKEKTGKPKQKTKQNKTKSILSTQSQQRNNNNIVRRGKTLNNNKVKSSLLDLSH